MLAKEVQQIIRPLFSPWCQAHGFRRTQRGGLAWYHPVEDHYFVIGFRIPRRWNQHRGGFLECHVSVQDQINPWIGSVRPALTRSVVSLVSDADRETIRGWYNEAAARTTLPEETGEALSGSQLTADAPAWFGQTDAVSGVEALVLEETGMDDEMARRLSEVATFCHLKRLSLAGNRRLGPAGIAAILHAEFAPRLEVLRMDGDAVDDSVVQQLVESALPSTIHLSIRQGRGQVDREAIARRFPNLSVGDRFVK